MIAQPQIVSLLLQAEDSLDVLVTRAKEHGLIRVIPSPLHVPRKHTVAGGRARDSSTEDISARQKGQLFGNAHADFWAAEGTHALQRFEEQVSLGWQQMTLTVAFLFQQPFILTFSTKELPLYKYSTPKSSPLGFELWMEISMCMPTYQTRSTVFSLSH